MNLVDDALGRAPALAAESRWKHLRERECARCNHSPGDPMRLALNVVGVLCLLMGGVWFLQGINILPGSFMTGQTKWAVYGGVLLVVGLGVLVMANRRRV